MNVIYIFSILNFKFFVLSLYCKLYANLIMKKIILTFLLFLSFFTAIYAKDQFFQYPQAPENLTSLSQRANYVVEHFWDRCNLKSAFSSRDKMETAFRDYVTYMQFASKDTTIMSINNLIKEVQKKPKNMLTLAQIAENTLYGDSALFWSDELYLYFTKAVVNTKKLSKADKARYEHHTQILTNSMIGSKLPNFEFETIDGNKLQFDSINAPAIILFFNDIDCTDCSLAKVRMATDINLNKLIDRGVIKIVSIYLGKATNEWKNEAQGYPKNWVIGACDEIYDMFDLRATPTIYQIDDKHSIIAKNLTVDGILSVVGGINL